MATLTCIYGDTGSRKTTALGKAAVYMYEATGGRPGRAIYADLGNWQAIRGVMDAGICAPFNISGEPDMPLLLHKLAQGWWPIELVDGAVPNTPAARHPVQAPWAIGFPRLKYDPAALAQVGFYIFEGLTSASDLMMKYLRDKQVVIAQDVVGKFSIPDQDAGPGKQTTFCANNMKHFGWAQDEMLALLSEFAALPVPRVFISAHEATGTDADTMDPIRGPGLPGKAGTGKVGRYLGDLIHFEIFNKTVGAVQTSDVKAYYTSHPDPKFPNISYKCKTRIPEDQVAALEKRFPGGWFAPGQFDEFLRFTDELLASSGSAIAAKKAEIDARLKEAAAT
jgi:hypothetical protein